MEDSSEEFYQCSLETNAHHEAAHAVVAASRKVPFRSVSIQAKGIVNNRQNYGSFDFDTSSIFGHLSSRPKLLDLFVVAAVGALAAKRYSGDEDALSTGAQDLEFIQGLTKNLITNPTEERDIQIEAYQTAAMELDNHWKTITRLAEQLLKVTTMTQAEVIDFLK
jgi:hypothetical protein